MDLYFPSSATETRCGQMAPVVVFVTGVVRSLSRARWGGGGGGDDSLYSNPLY